MAATYHVVVSSLNYYSSVVIDRRGQHAVHYCTGPCQLLTHGLDCTAAHRSACAELLDATVGPRPTAVAQPSTTLRHYAKFSALENGCFPIGGAEDIMEDCYQALQGVSRARRGLAGQPFSSSLKDITGEAINLASGKVKEFSHERDRVSSSHTILRKCRKARPDSILRRSADLDVLLSRFAAGNEENCQPFGLPPPDDPLGPEPSIGMRTGASCLNIVAEEDLVARILEKAKAEGGAPGQDMRACLEILLRCSEDLKRCTDIIRQCCISRKSTGDAGDYSGSEIAYRSALASLSGFLKKLPLGLGAGQAQPWAKEQGNLAELLRTLQWLQQSSPSSVFGDDLPPRYEDVVRSPPELSALLLPPPSPSQPEVLGKAEPSPNLLTPSLPASTHPCLLPHRGKVTANIQLNHPDSLSFVSSMERVIKKKSAVVTTPEEQPLYIVEDDGSSEAGGEGDGIFSEALGGVSRGNAMKLETGDCSQAGIPTKSVSLELRPSEDHLRLGASRDDSDEIDKLLTDLEHLSRSIVKEPPAKIRDLEQRNGSQDTIIPYQRPTCGPPVPLSRGSQDPVDGPGEDGDNALLQRILDSIEGLAQELVKNGKGRAGMQSKEREVMRILQDTLTTPDQPEVQEDPESDHIPGAASPEPAPTTNPTSSLFIQPTSEEWIQNKPEGGSGVPPPTPAPGSTPAFHYLGPVSPTSVPDTTSPLPHASSPPPAEKWAVPAPVNIPRFYFPEGLSPNCSVDLNQTVAIKMAFAGLPEEKADIHDMEKITKVCGCPLYWKALLFHGAGGDLTGSISASSFVAMWKKLLHSCYDDSAKFVYLLAKPDCKYLEQEDFIPLLQDIVDTHPGLMFLKDAPEFHSRYITTVIQRIFYTVNRSWTGRITMTELRRGNFLQTLALLEEEDDINLITDYFSYEHFYVIYCKFWELDSDHDLFIEQKDLARYNSHASSKRIIERLFSGAVIKGGSVQRTGRMCYAEFVWYIISEEDKKSPTSIEYWFRCMDLDGDGILSMYELEFFYTEQCERMENMGVEPLPFNDLLCQVLDLVKPECLGKITLSDLKRCRMAHLFYDTFINLEKYLDHEQRDPFTVQKDFDSEVPEPSDWEKFVAEEYDVLVAEDTASDPPAEGSLEDDCESDECVDTPVKGSKADMTEEIVLSNQSG
ncbi:serine/threonine-protein phosphatase 2A regulatory subunit B'' subunit alpha-like [Conger conger]|uniref:serine/threonine-protein phosphatase 2A regulatory subunit B'' subunit alpha-like n=1 Tax=Conger conger TaxID=82655 RepID=UPI002A5A85B3|nr:serine/threonine-protein phosphatase 2A regulatory subunit B'' subunit alpha-like [Conger conger]